MDQGLRVSWSPSSSDSVVSVSLVSLCLVWHCYNILVVWCGGGISFPLCFGASKLFGSCVDLFCLRVGVVSLKRIRSLGGFLNSNQLSSTIA